MKKLIQFSIKYSGIVLILAGLLVAWMGYQLPKMPVDVFPELNAPTITILTETGGLSADEVEQSVTLPIESKMNGIPGIRRVRSSSASSLSIIWVEFDWGVDIYRARQLVSERLSLVRSDLPDNIAPAIAPLASITGEVMIIAFSADKSKVDMLELRATVEFDIRNRLNAIPGIAQVVVIGGHLPEYTIEVDQGQLALYGLVLNDVIEAAEKSHSMLSAGRLQNFQGKEMPLRQSGKVTSVDDIRQTIVSYKNNRPITLADVATVKLTASPRRGAASSSLSKSDNTIIYSVPGVAMSIQKSPGINTLMLTEEIDKALTEIEASLPDGVVLNRDGFRQADFIKTSVDNVISKLWQASIFVIIVLLLFLVNVRVTLITLTAIPLSLAVTFIVMWLTDMTINVMTLGGIAIAIGELVDDAIIDVENVMRRLKQNQLLPASEKKTVREIVFSASNEIRSSVVFATLIIVLVMSPLLFLSGLEGRFFAPMGMTYIIAILTSMVVAMSVTPALCYLLFKKQFSSNTDKVQEKQDSQLVIWLKKKYKKVLDYVLRRRKFVVTFSLICTLFSILLASSYGTSFLPKFNESTFTVFLMAPLGTSLDSSERLGLQIDKQLIAIPGVKSVIRRTGRAELDEHAEPPSNSEIEVSLRKNVSMEKVKQDVDKVLDAIPGINTMIGQPIEHRLSHILSGTPAAIAINVYGPNMEQLRTYAKLIEARIKVVKGARDVVANREITITTVPINFRRDDLANWGLTMESANQQVNAGFYGLVTDTVQDGIRRYQIVVRLKPEARKTMDDIKNFILYNSNGQRVYLKQVADIGIEDASNLIVRENTQRKATISCNVAEGYNLGDLIVEIRKAVAPLIKEPGYYISYGGQFEAQQEASKIILSLGGLVILFILVLLTLAFNSLKSALLVMLNLPLALIGGVVAVYLSGGNFVQNFSVIFQLSDQQYVTPVLSIASLVGFITLFGISVRSGILLVKEYQRYEQKGESVINAILKGSLERLSPILMTALTAMLALIPMAMGLGKPGSELLAPLAIVVLGGLITSTVLNLIVVPGAYAWAFESSKEGKGN